MTLLTSQFRSSWTWERQKAFIFSTEITPSAIAGALLKGFRIRPNYHYGPYPENGLGPMKAQLKFQGHLFTDAAVPITHFTEPTPMTKPSSSFLHTLTKYLQKPWEITGPCTSPEYMPAIPKAVEFRIPSPATPAIKPCVPTSLPETVYDIKYFSRDQRRNRSPIRKILLRKDDVLKMMSERRGFSPEEFPRVYLTDKIEEDLDAIGGGYQK